MGKFGSEIKSAQFSIKLGGLTCQTIYAEFQDDLIFWDILTTANFWQIWSQFKKCSVFDQIWLAYQTNHAEFYGDVIFQF